MKLIVQADDYAMTDAVAEGILKCAKEGILTQTGLMTNGPHARYYASRMLKENPHIALGQEINLVSGYPLSDPKDIPSLVDEDGRLLTSGYHRNKDKEDKNHIKYEDAFKEIEAQYLAFIEIVKRKPYFFGLHSYHNEVLIKAMDDVQNKYGLKSIFDFMREVGIENPQMGPWYPLNKNVEKPTDYKYQLSFNAEEMFFNGDCAYITDHINEKDKVCMLHTHAGFVDKDLLDMSTLTMTRLIELELLCSPKIKKWLKDNNVELVNIRDL